MAADSGRPQRGVCFRAHGKRAVPSGYKLSRAQASFWPVFGTESRPTGAPEASSRGEGGFWTVFGTATLPTGTSEPSPRDERPADRSKNGNVPMLLPVFGTATLPTGISEPSLRGHCELVFRIAALLGFVKFTWHGPLLIIN